VAKLEGREWLPRDKRINAEYDVLVQCGSDATDARVMNLSSSGFRLLARAPLAVGSEVMLKSGNLDPVRAVICWASGLEAGGVFSEPVAL
jgi:hypothetical protein